VEEPDEYARAWTIPTWPVSFAMGVVGKDFEEGMVVMRVVLAGWSTLAGRDIDHERRVIELMSKENVNTSWQA
jgi:hypothetical protein